MSANSSRWTGFTIDIAESTRLGLFGVVQSPSPIDRDITFIP